MGVGEDFEANPYKVTRAQIAREATRLVPTNTRGLPEGFYRSDLLNYGCVIDRRSADEILNPSKNKGGPRVFLADDILILNQSILRAAFVPLSYDEGYPALPDGRPFWAQLEFEPPEVYAAFQMYLEMGTKGHRELYRLAGDPKVQRVMHNARIAASVYSNPSDAEKLHILPPPRAAATDHWIEQDEEGNIVKQNDDVLPTSIALGTHTPEGQRLKSTSMELQEWMLLYHWVHRAQAHDLYWLQGAQQKRQRLSLHLDGAQYTRAVQLEHKLMAFINADIAEMPCSVNDDGDPRFWAEMTPKTALAMLDLLQKTKRVALGLPAAGPAPAEDQGLKPSVQPKARGGQALTDQSTLGNQGGGSDAPAMSDDERMKKIAALVAGARLRQQQGGGS